MSNKGNDTTILAFDLVVKLPAGPQSEGLVTVTVPATDSCNSSEVHEWQSSLSDQWREYRNRATPCKKNKTKSHPSKMTTAQTAQAVPFFNSFASYVSFRGSWKQMLGCSLSVRWSALGAGSPEGGGGWVGGSAAAVVVGASGCGAVAVGAVLSSGCVRSLQGVRGRICLFFWAALDVAAHVFAHLKRKWKLWWEAFKIDHMHLQLQQAWCERSLSI